MFFVFLMFFYALKDHPSSDSYYDSDFADGEPSATPQPPVDVKIETDYDERPVVDSDEEDSQQEVDGEWGRATTSYYATSV